MAQVTSRCYSTASVHLSSTMPAHIVQMPSGFVVLRALQISVSITVLGLSAFLISQTSGAVFSAEAFATFVAAATLITTTYNIIAETAARGAYNRWAVLASGIVGFLLWLASTASLGALRATFVVPVTITRCTYGVDPNTGECITYKRGLNNLFKRYAWAGDVYLKILTVDTALAGVQTLLFLIGLIIFSIRLSRHRSSASRDSSPTHSFNNFDPVNVSNAPKQRGMKQSIHSIHGAPPVYSPSQPYSGPGNGLFNV